MGQFTTQSCSCIDYPCCGCGGNEVFTGEDAQRKWEEDQMETDMLDGIARDEEQKFAVSDEYYDADTPLGEELDGGCDDF